LLGCYDHSVTQAIIERRRAAKQAEGSEIRPTFKGPSQPAKHSGTLKLYVAEDFRKQHPDWREKLLDLLDQANAILIPSFGLRLESAKPESWTPACDPAQLDACLEELMRLDPGGPQVWVLGVLGAQAQFVESFDQLGRATKPGSHMVVRDVSDLAERDAIDRAFPSMTQARRDEIYRHRKQHKRLAIFLHEWAHTLGAEHSTESSSLLFPNYDDRMASFDEASSSTVTAALPARLQTLPSASDPAPSPTKAAATAAVANEGTEPVQERSAPHANYVVRGDQQELLATLTPADRATYSTATQESSPSQAYATLEPLVARYPDCYAVQHLACGLLMQLGRAADVQTVCGHLQKLSPKR
jgi:hypothetical protein